MQDSSNLKFPAPLLPTFSSPSPPPCLRIASVGVRFPSAFIDGLAKQVLNLPIHAAQFILRPDFEVGPQLGIDAEKKRFAFRHYTRQLYRVPVLSTGWTSDSPQRTTIKLLTIAARRSSSR